MAHCTIDRKALKAVSYMMANKDIRYYLNGVYVEYSPLETRLVATKEHMMAVHRSDAKGDNDGSGSFIIPADTVAVMARWKGISKRDLMFIRIEHVSDRMYRAQLHAQSLAFEAIDGAFPIYRKVIPAGEVSGVTARLDARYVYAMHRAGEALYDDPKKTPWVTVMQNGESPALICVNGNPDFVGVISPMRAGEVSTTAPAWAHEALPVPEPEVVARCGEAIAGMIDPNGALQAAGLLVVDGAPCDA
jgi:DNA polymerase-3 subunit beta